MAEWPSQMEPDLIVNFDILRKYVRCPDVADNTCRKRAWMIPLTVLVMSASACMVVVQPGSARGNADEPGRRPLQSDVTFAWSAAVATSRDGAFSLNEPLMLASADQSTYALKGPRLTQFGSPDFSVLVSLCMKAVPDCAPSESAEMDEADAEAVAETPVANKPASGLDGATPFSMREPGPGIAHGAIDRNLHASLTEADVPADVIAQVEHAWSGRVAMRATARKGDRFNVRYERVATRGRNGAEWRLVAAELTLRGERHTAVWFAAPGRPNGDYYTFDGRPLAEQRFAMPVRYVRISSPFGMRQHPVSGVHHGHSGTDFAAPTGTPVNAAAAGTVRQVAYEGGYGRYVVVSHGNGYSTLYAHLSAVAGDVRVGAAVKRGQRLGAVGSTGVATGPHLHFEVRRGNVPIDPVVALRERLTPDLAQAARPAFAQTVHVVRLQLAEATRENRVAVAHNP
ncbi:M23 family metallopeptidase [Burkholderia ubonensis]|uniref:M23 family metallopeptidase n=1 Tax=Burkholderia ubonensis TaxID=101571 RepID=UPI000A736694|nr:M23 family metallopeptidase [Burkholderia ubonensis]